VLGMCRRFRSDDRAEPGLGLKILSIREEAQFEARWVVAMGHGQNFRPDVRVGPGLGLGFCAGFC
jgi:hypothetical protein